MPPSYAAADSRAPIGSGEAVVVPRSPGASYRYRTSFRDRTTQSNTGRAPKADVARDRDPHHTDLELMRRLITEALDRRANICRLVICSHNPRDGGGQGLSGPVEFSCDSAGRIGSRDHLLKYRTLPVRRPISIAARLPGSNDGGESAHPDLRYRGPRRPRSVVPPRWDPERT